MMNVPPMAQKYGQGWVARGWGTAFGGMDARPPMPLSARGPNPNQMQGQQQMTLNQGMQNQMAPNQGMQMQNQMIQNQSAQARSQTFVRPASSHNYSTGSLPPVRNSLSQSDAGPPAYHGQPIQSVPHYVSPRMGTRELGCQPPRPALQQQQFQQGLAQFQQNSAPAPLQQGGTLQQQRSASGLQQQSVPPPQTQHPLQQLQMPGSDPLQSARSPVYSTRPPLVPPSGNLLWQQPSPRPLTLVNHKLPPQTPQLLTSANVNTMTQQQSMGMQQCMTPRGMQGQYHQNMQQQENFDQVNSEETDGHGGAATLPTHITTTVSPSPEKYSSFKKMSQRDLVRYAREKNVNNPSSSKKPRSPRKRSPQGRPLRGSRDLEEEEDMSNSVRLTADITVDPRTQEILEAALSPPRSRAGSPRHRASDLEYSDNEEVHEEQLDHLSHTVFQEAQRLRENLQNGISLWQGNREEFNFIAQNRDRVVQEFQRMLAFLENPRAYLDPGKSNYRSPGLQATNQDLHATISRMTLEHQVALDEKENEIKEIRSSLQAQNKVLADEVSRCKKAETELKTRASVVESSLQDQLDSNGNELTLARAELNRLKHEIKTENDMIMGKTGRSRKDLHALLLKGEGVFLTDAELAKNYSQIEQQTKNFCQDENVQKISELERSKESEILKLDSDMRTLRMEKMQLERAKSEMDDILEQKDQELASKNLQLEDLEKERQLQTARVEHIQQLTEDLKRQLSEETAQTQRAREEARELERKMTEVERGSVIVEDRLRQAQREQHETHKSELECLKLAERQRLDEEIREKERLSDEVTRLQDELRAETRRSEDKYNHQERQHSISLQQVDKETTKLRNLLKDFSEQEKRGDDVAIAEILKSVELCRETLVLAIAEGERFTVGVEAEIENSSKESQASRGNKADQSLRSRVQMNRSYYNKKSSPSDNHGNSLLPSPLGQNNEALSAIINSLGEKHKTNAAIISSLSKQLTELGKLSLCQQQLFSVLLERLREANASKLQILKAEKEGAAQIQHFREKADVLESALRETDPDLHAKMMSHYRDSGLETDASNQIISLHVEIERLKEQPLAQGIDRLDQNIRQKIHANAAFVNRLAPKTSTASTQAFTMSLKSPGAAGNSFPDNVAQSIAHTALQSINQAANFQALSQGGNSQAGNSRSASARGDRSFAGNSSVLVESYYANTPQLPGRPGGGASSIGPLSVSNGPLSTQHPRVDGLYKEQDLFPAQQDIQDDLIDELVHDIDNKTAELSAQINENMSHRENMKSEVLGLKSDILQSLNTEFGWTKSDVLQSLGPSTNGNQLGGGVKSDVLQSSGLGMNEVASMDRNQLNEWAKGIGGMNTGQLAQSMGSTNAKQLAKSSMTNAGDKGVTSLGDLSKIAKGGSGRPSARQSAANAAGKPLTSGSNVGKQSGNLSTKNSYSKLYESRKQSGSGSAGANSAQQRPSPRPDLMESSLYSSTHSQKPGIAVKSRYLQSASGAPSGAASGAANGVGAPSGLGPDMASSGNGPVGTASLKGGGLSVGPSAAASRAGTTLLNSARSSQTTQSITRPILNSASLDALNHSSFMMSARSGRALKKASAANLSAFKGPHLSGVGSGPSGADFSGTAGRDKSPTLVERVSQVLASGSMPFLNISPDVTAKEAEHYLSDDYLRTRHELIAETHRSLQPWEIELVNHNVNHSGNFPSMSSQGSHPILSPRVMLESQSDGTGTSHNIRLSEHNQYYPGNEHLRKRNSSPLNSPRKKRESPNRTRPGGPKSVQGMYNLSHMSNGVPSGASIQSPGSSGPDYIQTGQNTHHTNTTVLSKVDEESLHALQET